MLNSVKSFLENVNWIMILISLIANVVLIITAIAALKSYVKRKLLFRIKKAKEGLGAFSIGLGKNDPYNAVVEFMGSENKSKVVKYYKSHAGDPEAFLSDDEIQDAMKDVDIIIGKMRRENFKEILIFYAGPVSAALQIGYMLKNFRGVVKFMQPDQKTKEYKVMLMPF